MRRHEIDTIFGQMVAPLELEIEQTRRDAFVPESRPIPEGLIPNGLPLGHIALRGDFAPQPDEE